MLNAFRHQGKNHHVPRNSGQLILRCGVLNAFRHQGKNHAGGKGPCRILDVMGCSTPFGIKARITRRSARAVAPAGSCAQRLSASRQESPSTSATTRPRETDVLNAFRHQGKNHWCMPAWYEELIPARCSTPFGIKARITRTRRRARRARLRGAQRLSASRQESPDKINGKRSKVLSECSTPFGIKARITGVRRDSACRAARSVLNAFRHQGKNHPQVPHL